MARLKAMVKSALEDRSPRFMLGTIALAVVVALVAGFAVGYKIDDSRGGGTKTAKKATTKKGGKVSTRAVRLKAAPQLIGSVSSAKVRQINVVNASGATKRIGVGPKTRVAIAVKAKGTAITVGSKVIFAPSATSKTTAVEVVVLPSRARIGYPVSAVVPGTSMTLGSNTVIKTTGAIVRTTRSGTRRSIAKGTKVFVNYFVVRGRRNQGTDIVVLPKDSKFK